MTDSRLDPPFVADEVTMLRSWLDYHRQTLRRKAEGLDDEQLRIPLPPSDLTIGSLLKHLAFVEDYWFGVVLLGRDPIEPWASVDWDADPDWDLTSSRLDTAGRLRDLHDDSVAAADRLLEDVLADGDLDTLSVRDRAGERVSLRWILLHMIEEYARHNGHADLIRQSIDGEVGE